LSIVIAVAIALAALGAGFALGRARRPREQPPSAREVASPPAPIVVEAPVPAAEATASAETPASTETRASAAQAMEATVPPAAATPAPAAAAAGREDTDRAAAERARVIRAFESETAMLRRAIAARDADIVRLAAFAGDRARLHAEIAAARGEIARYRQLVVDIEERAAPALLDGSGPDDLKLIVGIGPVLERMLHQLGIGTYRQIARWSERDIDEFDAKLPEFPGRIRRDAWVTQARALHQSKYGETLPVRERR